MLKTKKRIGMAVATVAAIGANQALAAGGQGGMIRFTGAVYQPGYSVSAAPRAVSPTDGLRAQASTTGDQVVVDFRSGSRRPVPAKIRVDARTASSATWRRVPAGRDASGMHVRYDGFQSGVLTGNNGTLTFSRPPGMEPALAVVTTAYR